MFGLTMFCKKPLQLVKCMNNTSIRFNSSGRMKLDGKVAVVTGSTDGIGLAIAERLGQDGAKVVVSSRKQDNVDKAVKKLSGQGVSVLGLVCNVASAEQRTNLIKKTVSEFGGIDIFVSNAGTNPTMHGALSIASAAWDKLMDVNVKSGLLMTQEVVPLIEERGGGSIVFISSIAGLRPANLLGPYSVSKSALITLSKVLSEECIPSKIRVNCVAPGFITTKFNALLRENEEINSEILKQIPMRRFGVPSEVASLVSFLCSDDASYITGECFPVSGGMQSRL